MGPMIVLRRLGLLGVVAVVLLSGCGSGGERTGTADPGSSDSLLAFTGTTIDGKPFDGKSLAGKPAVLWFWAPWCPVCLQQAAGVRAAAKQYGDKVTIVGVAGLDKAAAMPEFVRLAKVESITNLSDEPGAIWKRFGITSQSTFVLLDAAGQQTGHGVLSAKEVPGKVKELLAGT
jgi:thiol-disulfide isomerase/thioredoxin